MPRAVSFVSMRGPPGERETWERQAPAWLLNLSGTREEPGWSLAFPGSCLCFEPDRDVRQAAGRLVNLDDVERLRESAVGGQVDGVADRGDEVSDRQGQV